MLYITWWFFGLVIGAALLGAVFLWGYRVWRAYLGYFKFMVLTYSLGYWITTPLRSIPLAIVTGLSMAAVDAFFALLWESAAMIPRTNKPEATASR